MKSCTHCHRVLPESEFYVQRYRSGRTRLASWCKDCTRSMQRTREPLAVRRLVRGRKRKIPDGYFPHTYQEISDAVGLTKQRVHQICMTFERRMRVALAGAMA